MSHHSTFRTLEFKLYPNIEQQQTLDRWLRVCCRTYNAALEERIDRYRKEKKPTSFYDQNASLTKQRKLDPELEDVPVMFSRDALRRVDRGMKAFFRRLKSGEKPGFPRFRKASRYNSFEILDTKNYISGNKVFIPKLGYVIARGPFDLVAKTQKLLRVIRRASGWYAQVLCECESKTLQTIGSECGIDLGLKSFLTLDTGEVVGNPRLLRKSAKRLRSAQKCLSRRQRGSRRYAKQRRKVARLHERTARKRKGFCHRLSREIVNRFDRIAIEDLQVSNMIRGRFAKSIYDAAWGQFVSFLTVKAASAGRTLVRVNPRGTSQECPSCGLVVRKELKERVHDCPCGCRLDRDHAAAIVISNRAFRPEFVETQSDLTPVVKQSR